MKSSEVTIQKNQKIAADMNEMVVQITKTEEDQVALQKVRPGQFINIQIEGFYLRRPISICDWDTEEGTITIVYQTVGHGTEAMSRMRPGERLDILWPLGNGYRLSDDETDGQDRVDETDGKDRVDETVGQDRGDETDGKPRSNEAARPLLIGGGAGVPPMFGLCKRLVETGLRPVVILGFRSAENVFYQDRFEEMGADVTITTEDGSLGEKGFATDAATARLQSADADSQNWQIFACGPEAMLRAIDRTLPEEIPGQMSFEERMGCGFGACMGCSCETKYGSKRICKDGPVLERSEIIW